MAFQERRHLNEGPRRPVRGEILEHTTMRESVCQGPEVKLEVHWTCSPQLRRILEALEQSWSKSSCGF